MAPGCEFGFGWVSPYPFGLLWHLSPCPIPANLVFDLFYLRTLEKFVNEEKRGRLQGEQRTAIESRLEMNVAVPAIMMNTLSTTEPARHILSPFL